MENENLKENMVKDRDQLTKAQNDIKKKVNQLTQVTNMKNMIVEKNTQIKTLREKLGQYENIEDD